MQYSPSELQQIFDSGNAFIVRSVIADGQLVDDIAFDVDEALEQSARRLGRANVESVEIFRITSSGNLSPTLGPTFGIPA